MTHKLQDTGAPRSELETVARDWPEDGVATADGIGTAENPVCGDVMTVFIQVASGSIASASFQTRGCDSASAAGEALTALILHKTIAAANHISSAELVAMLGGLPRFKWHTATLAVDALRQAISNYQSRVDGGDAPVG